MAVELDVTSGRLRLEPEAFDVLVAARRGDAAVLGSDAERAGLQQAGALTEDGVHPTLAPGLDALLDPWCELGVLVAGGAGAQRHQCWVSPGAAGVLLQLSEDAYEFATMPPAFVPVTLARVVQLGPRPDAPPEPEPFELPTRLVRELLAEQRGVRRAAAVRLVGALPEAADGWVQAASGGAWRAWQVEARWRGREGEIAYRALTVLDSPAGLLAVRVPEEEAEQVSVAPVTSSVLWRELSVLLPGDAELADRSGA